MTLTKLFIHTLITDLLLDCLAQKNPGQCFFTLCYQLNFGNCWQKPVKAREHEQSGQKVNEVQTRFKGKTLR